MTRDFWRAEIGRYATLRDRIAERLNTGTLRPDERWLAERDLAATEARIKYAQHKHEDGPPAATFPGAHPSPAGVPGCDPAAARQHLGPSGGADSSRGCPPGTRESGARMRRQVFKFRPVEVR